jgi:PPM family protein phosphatase
VTVGRSAALTDTGRKRRRNEDSFISEPPLFAIADGMGGAQAGEVASRLAADALREHEVGGTAEERLVALVQEANRRVYERQATDQSASGMGTTVTVALVEGDEVVLGHVGDSRAYRFRAGELEQLTEDHSLVQELLKDGRLTPEEARVHPQQAVITRALGTDPDVDVDTFRVDARPGDVFLLCSDGLSGMVGDEIIRDLVDQNRDDLDAVTRALVDAANAGGGEDNITVVCFEVGDGSAGTDDAATAATTDLAAAPDPADEDTLSGLEAIPTVEIAPATMETALLPVDEPGEVEDEVAAEQADEFETESTAPEQAVEADDEGEAEAEGEAEGEDGDEPAERRDEPRRRFRTVAVLLVLVAVAAAVIWYFLLGGE